MRDYRHVPDDGPPMFVAEMPTHIIESLLRDGLQIVEDSDYFGETVEDIEERLRIELTARGLSRK